MKGGARPGAGRKKGSKNEASKKREESVKLAAQLVAEFMPNAFAGDSHALLMAVYKNQDLPLLVRIDAAKAAIGFEKPRLSATNVTLDDKRDPEQFTEAELEIIVREGIARAAQTKESQTGTNPVH
tara:strand:+ start:5974 stop:6351 length:378 start_codon:yes stop_codon:yes gene_type:complete